MRFQFEPDLDYQMDAIAAVCGLFHGQELCHGEFRVDYAMDGGELPGLVESDLGVGNRLTLHDNVILENLRVVQLRNGLFPSARLDSLDFTVEMETGTGKTYVYLRTIFELNRLYGFTKFAIVVPSIAIKEGVSKSLEVMGEHFRALYSGVSFEHFIYDSSKLVQIRNFATSSHIEIMVMTVGAINKLDFNTIYQESEKTGGEAPIDLIKATNPIIIVDEPQSVDGGLKGRGREALAKMNPLCTLRYSATHAEEYHMVYRLNAVDAYERQLVKQIEVSSGTVVDDHSNAYIRLLSTRSRNGVVTARVELDVDRGSGRVQRRQLNVQGGDDLWRKTNREVYREHRIGEIRVRRDSQSLELRIPSGERWLKPGEAHGSVDGGAVHHEMIRRAIMQHLDKEKRLQSRGIKVLTLFFIDKVSNYRGYDEEGNPIEGVFARTLEGEYCRIARDPNYRELFEGIDVASVAKTVHNGYFSVDRNKRWIDTPERETKQVDRDNSERAYNLIMRHKERLLSLDEPLKFIFSHSALREGWDNPNVFQICVLRDIQTVRARRQTIGRGLRLCVNQEGERQRGFEINTLTVIAQESYEDFAENLQQEIEEETGVRFGIVEEHQFALVETDGAVGYRRRLGMELSQELWRYLVAHGYLNDEGKITDVLRTALSAGNFTLSENFEPFRDAVIEVLRRADTRIIPKNAEERRTARPRESVLHSEEFISLWERIKHKTTYRVQFDNEQLLEECVKALNSAPPIPRPRMNWRTGTIQIEQRGVQGLLRETASPVNLSTEVNEWPDVLTELQDRTQLTRRSIYRVLCDSGRLDDFAENPQKFIEIAADVINRRKELALVDGIRYKRSGCESYFAQELFVDEELTGYLSRMMKSRKSVYDHVLWDSCNEMEFAEELEASAAVKVYAKLPRRFKIPTPLGAYNPDWAILVETDESERLYFVAETKGSSFVDDLRSRERAKVECGQAHFEALEIGENSVKYRVVHRFDELFN
ncbi:MAG: DEAD/DEAH box helicase family protein [Spirochaetaceae bacterium]|nr:DEAD/DEAH box helicase family protein [Spirochaetaceae bacterium]